MSDAPEGDDVTRGGKVLGDPDLADATPVGRQGIAYSESGGDADDNTDHRFQSERGGGTAGGSGQGA
ncbi:MAG TPA: hypothetical protein VHT97_14255 [Acidimicrobiales bacterium]|jgi:hypothetical protein|nr:hypothetical protein [Acidimicrobiales bacterium]